MVEKQNPKRKQPAEVVDDNENENSEEEHCLSDDDWTFVDGIRIPPATKPVCSFDPSGPRLIITKIVNNFFKSYAEEQVLGPFHKCFNAIVGPNGSGKSNVIDSMLFVFGYRASKIRSKKVSVLLHNSESFRNVTSCTVSVHFAEIIDKEGDEYEIVPSSEFVVSRTANRDNSSFYQLNGRKVQFKEVGTLLKKHGIDLDHNRFLILQGEVEQIAMMKCKAENENESGMLEYLEDIIGTSRYKKPLIQVMERVDLLAERRTEKFNRLQLVEKELNELRGPMEEAVGFLKTENKIIGHKNFLYQRNIYNLEKKLEKVEEDKKEVSEAQKEMIANLNKFREEKSKKDDILQKETSRKENLQKRKDGLTEAFDKANNKDIQLKETMIQMNNKRKKTKELIIGEQKRLEKLEKVPSESKEGILECEKKMEEQTAKKEKFEEEKAILLATLSKETKSLQEKKEAMQIDLSVLKKSVDEAKSAFDLAESELKIYVSNEENERTKYETLKTTYEGVKSTLKEKSEQINILQKKIPATEKSLQNATTELNTVKVEEAKIITKIRKDRSNLEEKRTSMQASRSRNKVLDSLMRQKSDGNCPGLYGRLGDLGGIDQKYDVAISTACGPLDNIVVDTVATAQWCIEYLKKYDLGRATFIALDKQEYLRNHANSRIQTPENVPRLFDLVEVQDDAVRTAFYYALRDTLVADDLEQASRIAYGAHRYRVVTLGGDLIETTGTMSGGGKSVSRGRMGRSVRVSNVDPKELENMEEYINEMEQHVRELRQKQNTLESQINTLQPELRQMKLDYEKFSVHVQELRQQEPKLAKQLKEQEGRTKTTKADPVQVKKLTTQVEKYRKVYEEAAETAGALQAQVDEVTKEIKEKTSGKMKAVDKNINEAAKIIDKCKAEITRLRVAVTAAERNSKKTAGQIKTMEQDVVDMETKLKEMQQERLEIEEDARKLLKCVEEIAEQLAEADEAFADIKKEVGDLTKQENKLKSEKVDIDQKLKSLDGKIHDYKGSIHSLEIKIKQLKLQDIPDETAGELKQYTKEELEEINVADIEKELEAAETHLRIAKPNLNAIEEYRKKQSVYVVRSKELEEIINKRNEMRKLYDNMRQQRKDEFLTGYNIIKLKLKEMYQMITLGGDADFEMVDNYDPFTEGIQFNVRPPKKSWKKISNLSGGEKTLSSLALVFALHYYKPSPLYVMDEIDAALDFKNVSIVGHYIKERTKNAQFIIISLRSNMFELCDNLIGIYKTYNCTKTITIDPRIYDKKENRIENRENTQNQTNRDTTVRNSNRSIENGDAELSQDSNISERNRKSQGSSSSQQSLNNSNSQTEPMDVDL